MQKALEKTPEQTLLAGGFGTDRRWFEQMAVNFNTTVLQAATKDASTV